MKTRQGEVLLFENIHNRAFVDEFGVIRVEKQSVAHGFLSDGCLRAVVEESGNHFSDSYREWETVEKYKDRPFSEYKKHLEERRKRRERRNENGTQRERLDKHREKFGDMVIGVDKKIDVYPTGFRISLLFNTSKSYDEQLSYLQGRFDECLRFVKEQASRTRSAVAKNVLPYCKLSEVIMTKRNEAVFVFEIADRVRIAFET